MTTPSPLPADEGWVAPTTPLASIVIPVNALADIERVGTLLRDLDVCIRRPDVELLLVVNNFPPSAEPEGVERLRNLPITVLAIPAVEVRHGEVLPLAVRAVGAQHAAGDLLIHLDADVRVPHASALVDWYLAQYCGGARVSATDVGFYDVPKSVSIRARVLAHGLARWGKRTIMRTPVTRGSNYATDRVLFLEAYGRGMLADELNVGPALVALGARFAYSSDRRLRVLTSARRFRPGWGRLVRYLRYRLSYNLRTLPVDEAAASRTRRWEDPPDRFE